MGNSPNRVLAIIVMVVLVAVLIVTVFSSTKSVLTPKPGTPEASVQDYLTAVFAGKNIKAAEFLAPESGCTVQDLDRVYVLKSARVDLVKMEVDSESAQIWIKVESPSGSPFETPMIEDHTLRLIRVNVRWLLTGTPWPLYNCLVVPK
jgi:hypothetical protein